jgi:predicted O-methyltransferase YrrM
MTKVGNKLEGAAMCDEIVSLSKAMQPIKIEVDSIGLSLLCTEHKQCINIDLAAILPPEERTYVPEVEGWMSPLECNLLYETAMSMPEEMGLLLEIGSWKGRSTSALTLAGPTICIDTFAGSAEHTQNGPVDTFGDFINNMESVGRLFRVVILHGLSQTVLPSLMGTKIRLALIDGSHEEKDVASDLAGVWPLMVPGGVMFLDDVDWPGVVKATNDFCQTHGVQVTMYEGTKLASIVKPSPPVVQE